MEICYITILLNKCGLVGCVGPLKSEQRVVYVTFKPKFQECMVCRFPMALSTHSSGSAPESGYLVMEPRINKQLTYHMKRKETCPWLFVWFDFLVNFCNSVVVVVHYTELPAYPDRPFSKCLENK